MCRILSKLGWYREIFCFQKKIDRQMHLMQRVLNELKLSSSSVYMHFSVMFPQTIWQALWIHVEFRITALAFVYSM